MMNGGTRRLIEHPDANSTCHRRTRKRGARLSSPSGLSNRQCLPSRHLGAARSPRHLAGVEAAGADLHLDDLALGEGAHDLQVRLPRTPRLVVRVRDVVAERDTLAAVVAAIALDSHDISPGRTRCAPC